MNVIPIMQLTHGRISVRVTPKLPAERGGSLLTQHLRGSDFYLAYLVNLVFIASFVNLSLSSTQDLYGSLGALIHSVTIFIKG